MQPLDSVFDCEPEECDHPHLDVYADYEGGEERHLQRHFTMYYCPDCDYSAETPPDGWEPPFNEPY